MGDTRHLFRTNEDPDPSDRGSGWKMTRPWTKKPPRLAIVSDMYFRCRIHFFGGSTIPCLQEGCASCLKLNVSRWRCYLLVIEEKTKMRRVMELSAEVKQTLDDIWSSRRSLRRQIIVAARTHERQNAKHQVAHVGTLPPDIFMPEDEDIWPIIARIFGVHSDSPMPKSGMTEADEVDARADLDLPGQIVARFAQRGAPEAICNSEEERAQLEDLINRNMANGNGRTSAK